MSKATRQDELNTYLVELTYPNRTGENEFNVRTRALGANAAAKDATRQAADATGLHELAFSTEKVTNETASRREA